MARGVTLTEFEYVLLPVDDRQATLRSPHAHVPGSQPAVVVEHLLRALGVLEVPSEHVGPANLNFASSETLFAEVGSIRMVVLHLGYASESDLQRGKGHSNVRDPCLPEVGGLGHGGGAGGLGLPVALVTAAAGPQQNPEEGHHVRGTGRAATVAGLTTELAG